MKNEWPPNLYGGEVDNENDNDYEEYSENVVEKGNNHQESFFSSSPLPTVSKQYSTVTTMTDDYRNGRDKKLNNPMRGEGASPLPTTIPSAMLSRTTTHHEGDNEAAGQTTFGWDENLECGIAYMLGNLSSIILLVFEARNRNVRFHAWQSFILFTSFLSVKLLGLLFLPFNPPITLWSIGIIEIISACYMSYWTVKGYQISIPRISDWAKTCVSDEDRLISRT